MTLRWFIVETQFGTTVLAGYSDFGRLAVLSRSKGGRWEYREILDWPSDVFGYAFAPDGTLLIHDRHGAAAVTKDLRIVRLECG